MSLAEGEADGSLDAHMAWNRTSHPIAETDVNHLEELLDAVFVDHNLFVLLV
jgi:hypothetical protein